ncbi:sulfite oxidase-like oxidoreductase [Candidatus Cyanaurora vandensis]|uniref:sulfite oxidase-like oxidoreductase n=1 Tax=Candidatus Cyanaurora vandensis TaxID=2714958 RepID=UPI0025807F66|nr:sulfite oxidase-like oxidoreductase [Candidatus Cyanaurora vandensis]
MFDKLFKTSAPDRTNRVPPGQNLTNGFPVLTYGSTPRINMREWQLKVFGLATVKEFTWQDFQDMPQIELTADFHCVTRWSKLDVQWRGVRVLDFMKLIEVDPKAQHVLEHSYGGYTTNLALEDFLKEENILATSLFKEPIPAEHGGPLRLLVPHLYAWKSAKWLNGLEFTEQEKLGFWEVNGYHRRGEPWAEERYSG